MCTRTPLATILLNHILYNVETNFAFVLSYARAQIIAFLKWDLSLLTLIPFVLPLPCG